jgi:hypothetical protein
MLTASQEISRLLWNKMIFLPRSQELVARVLIEMSQFYTLQPYYITIHLNLNFPSLTVQL